MERSFKKLRDLIISASEQFLVASLQAFHAIVFALVTIPGSVSSATSLGELAWDQLSSPSPHAPAGDITLRLIKIWTNHVFDVELPRFRNLAARFDWKMALSFRSLDLRSLSLAKALLVHRALAHMRESKTQLLRELPGWHRDRSKRARPVVKYQWIETSGQNAIAAKIDFVPRLEALRYPCNKVNRVYDIPSRLSAGITFDANSSRCG